MMDQLSSQLHVDLETFGIQSTSQVLSIGAVFGEIDEFYVEIDTGYYERHGSQFTINQSTLEWWEKQGGFQPSLTTLDTPMEATKKFVEWVKDVTANTENWTVWANSPSFDCAILQHHMQVFGLSVPWAFWQERDVRTMKSLAQDMRLPIRFPKNPHNALQDAKNQRDLVASCYMTFALKVQQANEFAAGVGT